MGQAKLRGSRDDRIKEAVEQLERLRPDKLTCNNCQTDFTDFEMLNTKGMDGVDMACVGECPSCKDVTWGLKGDPIICQAFAEHIMHERGLGNEQPKFGIQRLSK